MKPFRTVMVAAAALILSSAPAHAGPIAHITGTYDDGCRDFSAASSKDISHVVLEYADGRVVKDETTTTPDYSIDGGTGDELEQVVVKSGTTRGTFPCETGGPPEAVLEIRLSAYCHPFTSSTDDTFYWCRDGLPDVERTAFVDPGELRIDLGCLVPDPPCHTATFRGTGSTDPDGDIATSSISFGDADTQADDWNGSPPAQVTHEYAATACSSTYCHVTLTVIDSEGHSDSDSLDIAFYDLTPD